MYSFLWAHTEARGQHQASFSITLHLILIYVSTCLFLWMCVFVWKYVMYVQVFSELGKDCRSLELLWSWLGVTSFSRVAGACMYLHMHAHAHIHLFAHMQFIMQNLILRSFCNWPSNMGLIIKGLTNFSPVMLQFILGSWQICRDGLIHCIHAQAFCKEAPHFAKSVTSHRTAKRSERSQRLC